MIIEEIPIEKIRINIDNPRKEFDKESLNELAESIKNRGLINPISVKKIEGTDEYELICGERRLKAHKLADKKLIQAIIRDYNSKDEEMVDSLIENLHRTDLNSVEKENFITRLWETGKYSTREALARALGMKSRGMVREYIQAKDVRDKTNAGVDISTRSIRDVMPLIDLEDKKQLFKKLEKKEINSINLRDVANVIKKSPVDVKQAFYSNKISIEQAEKISNIKDEKIRNKIITAHKNIRSIDRGIEKNFERVKPKTEKDTIRIKETIDDFRNNAVVTQKAIQGTIKSLMKCIPVLNLMDETQLKRLNHFQELFETNVSNALQLSENLKEKIKA